MAFKDTYIYQKLEDFVLGNADERKINVEAESRKTGTGSITGQFTSEAKSLQVQTLDKWKTAILLATDPEEPNRSALKQLYDSFESDNHLMATIGNRIDAVRSTPFKLVDKNGDEDSEKTDLLKKLWFIEEEGFIDIALKSKYIGTKVIELYELKEDGHLKEVTEVDMAHVIPEKGLIVKESGDTNGWNYKEGVFSDVYLQVGKDKMLGLFAVLAPIVLAKKMGIGAWLDYINKYGIPPIFLFSDRFDKKRMEQLYDAMINFKSNHFVIGQGNERVEIGNTHNSGNSQLFKDVTKLANDELSKRINGGTGTTDEKSHVGAAQVHAENLNTKIKLDKFFIEVLVNEELIPRLVKLSPIYTRLDNYTFKWDDAETLTLQEFLDYVVSLSANYEFDIEQLAERTGMPIVGIKSLLNNQEKQNEPTPEKKKSKIKQEVQAFYDGVLNGLNIEAVDISKYTKLVEQIAKGLHNGTIKSEDLNAELINQIYTDLVEGTADGWGDDWIKFGNDLDKDKTVLSIQKNIFRFSGAKTYTQLVEFNTLLHKDGKLRPYQEFKDEVLKANSRYNQNYLQAEHQTATQSGHHARNWQSFQKDKDIFPNLEYRTVADNRVRDEHAILHKVIKPIDDPFWNTHYPPNGWRCRCYVVQSTNTPTTENPAINIKPEFKNNVGKTGAVYSEKHPFFVIAKTAEQETQNAFELSKLHAPYTKAYKTKNGATVEISPFADLADFEANFNTAKQLADNKISVKVRPHIILQGYKNPEYEIDGLLAERKSPTSFNFRNVLRKASKQNSKIVVLDLSFEGMDLDRAKRKITAMLDKPDAYVGVEKVMILFDDKIEIVERKKAT